MTTTTPTVSELMSKESREVASFLGWIYEHSYWVAEDFCKGDLTKYTTVSELAAAMKATVDAAPRAKKMELLCAHPDLCEKVGKLETLTEESRDEQSRSGLQSLTEEELASFNKMNTAYRDKCGFPLILAVRNATKQTVLAGLEGRLRNSVETEFNVAMQQVHKIAWMRLLSKINTEDAQGFLTCHVLDTANGIPGELFVKNPDHRFVTFDSMDTFLYAAKNMRITLTRLSPPESAGVIGEFVTNDDGRMDCGPALKGGKEFLVGVYEWTFYVGDVSTSLFKRSIYFYPTRSSQYNVGPWTFRSQYFASLGTFTSGQPFVDVVPLRFGIDNPDDHYHGK